MRYLSLFLFLLLCNISDCQVIIEKTISIEAKIIYADNLDNFYVLSDNAFIKYNSEGEQISTYYPKGGEEITYADIRNPFKIIVFFSKQNKIVLLDNNLIPIKNDIFLDEADIFGNALIVGATIGGYWVYDKITGQLLKLNSDFKLQHKKDLHTIYDIVSIENNSTHIFLQSDSGRIIYYNYITANWDYFYSIIKKNYTVRDDIVTYYSEKEHAMIIIKILNDAFSVDTVKLPEDIEIIDAAHGNSKIFFFDESKIYISSIKQN